MRGDYHLLPSATILRARIVSHDPSEGSEPIMCIATSPVAWRGASAQNVTFTMELRRGADASCVWASVFCPSRGVGGAHAEEAGMRERSWLAWAGTPNDAPPAGDNTPRASREPVRTLAYSLAKAEGRGGGT